MLSLSAAQLGHDLPKVEISGAGYTFRLLSVLGRGSFGVAVKAMVTKSEVGRESRSFEGSVVIKKLLSSSTKFYSTSSSTSLLEMLERECTVLRQFRTLNNDNLPRLFTNDWVCNKTVPFIPFEPLATPLPIYASCLSQNKELSRKELEKKVKIFESDVRTALSAAHGLGYYHCDLRPDNVVVREDDRFVVIDWGLALNFKDKNHKFMHDYLGGIDFFHDDIVRFSAGKAESFVYQADYDFSAMTCITYWLIYSRGLTELPWSGLKWNELIKKRKKCMGSMSKMMKI